MVCWKEVSNYCQTPGYFTHRERARRNPCIVESVGSSAWCGRCVEYGEFLHLPRIELRFLDLYDLSVVTILTEPPGILLFTVLKSKSHFVWLLSSSSRGEENCSENQEVRLTLWKPNFLYRVYTKTERSCLYPWTQALWDLLKSSEFPHLFWPADQNFYAFHCITRLLHVLPLSSTLISAHNTRGGYTPPSFIIFIHFVVSLELQPKSGLGRLIVWVSRSHTHTHTHTHIR